MYQTQKQLKLTKPWLSHSESNAVQRVLDSGWFAEGPETAKFEQKVADYVGSKYAVAVCNCTVALTLCLQTVHVEKQPIVVPSFTHPATLRAILNAGAFPVLADSNPQTYNIASSIEGFHTLTVSLFGHPNTLNVKPIVEDAACSLGASYNGLRVGKEYLTCFSFHPRKLVTCGEGAVITTNNQQTALALRSLKNFGKGGSNYKLDDIRAAIANAQMDKLDWIIQRRREMAHIYTDLLEDKDWVIPPRVAHGAFHTYQTYAVYLKRSNRDETIKHLAQNGIETQVGSYANHLSSEFECAKSTGNMDDAVNLHFRLLALPMSYDLTEEDQKFVIEQLAEAVNN